MAKGLCCSYRGSVFCFQHPQVAHNHCKRLQHPLLASKDTTTHMVHIYTCRHTHTHKTNEFLKTKGIKVKNKADKNNIYYSVCT